ncbi:Protein LIAT1 [Liparis tanakae]|uniref:Protein LIAT1 n=1 Tax=Liparis tanakae TaxID=230148 RepID=A0A4Z2GUE5_9TELE|nr:Protein LIAT1 [Liparis tanakae]
MSGVVYFQRAIAPCTGQIRTSQERSETRQHYRWQSVCRVSEEPEVLNLWTSQPEVMNLWTSPPEAMNLWTSPPEVLNLWTSPPEAMNLWTSPPEVMNLWTSPPEAMNLWTSPPEAMNLWTSPPEAMNLWTSPPEAMNLWTSPPEAMNLCHFVGLTSPQEEDAGPTDPGEDEAAAKRVDEPLWRPLPGSGAQAAVMPQCFSKLSPVEGEALGEGQEQEEGSRWGKGFMVDRIRARQSATSLLGAQARAGASAGLTFLVHSQHRGSSAQQRLHHRRQAVTGREMQGPAGGERSAVGGVYEGGTVDLPQNQQGTHLMGLGDETKDKVQRAAWRTPSSMYVLLGVGVAVRRQRSGALRTLLQARCSAVFLCSSSSVRSALARLDPTRRRTDGAAVSLVGRDHQSRASAVVHGVDLRPVAKDELKSRDILSKRSSMQWGPTGRDRDSPNHDYMISVLIRGCSSTTHDQSLDKTQDEVPLVLLVGGHGGRHQVGQDLRVASGRRVVQRRPALDVPTQGGRFVLQQGAHAVIVAQHRLNTSNQAMRYLHGYNYYIPLKR